jgi:hypothetical protein
MLSAYNRLQVSEVQKDPTREPRTLPLLRGGLGRSVLLLHTKRCKSSA